MRQLERSILLNVIDRKWRDHLYEMDYLREGIHLRSMAQRDPVAEYQREGFDMFTGMLEGIKEEALGFLYNVQVQTQEIAPAPSLSKPVPAPMLSAAAAAQAENEAAGTQAPAALRAVGIGEGGPADSEMTYSGPAENGGVEILTDEEEEGDPALTSRRERRAAARAGTKGGAKPPKSKKRRR